MGSSNCSAASVSGVITIDPPIFENIYRGQDFIPSTKLVVISLEDGQKHFEIRDQIRDVENGSFSVDGQRRWNRGGPLAWNSRDKIPEWFGDWVDNCQEPGFHIHHAETRMTPEIRIVLKQDKYALQTHKRTTKRRSSSHYNKRKRTR